MYGIIVEVYQNDKLIYSAWLYSSNPKNSPFLMLFENIKDAEQKAEKHKSINKEYQQWSKYSDIRISIRKYQ